MEITAYRVDQRVYLTMDLETDRRFWERFRRRVHPVAVYPSIGQACRNTGLSALVPPLELSLTGNGNEKFGTRRGAVQSGETFLPSLLEGRALLWEEVLHLLRKTQGEVPDEDRLRSALQSGVLSGWVQVLPGVESPKGGPHRCNRCGGGSEGILHSFCARCGTRCAWCDHCLPLGKSRSCTPFLLFRGSSVIRARSARNVYLRLPDLSHAQREAVRICLERMDGEGGDFLLWAVTGSGKTEVLLPSVQRVLERGGRVLWAAPRRDVVDELGDRFRKAFPRFPVTVLHGESGFSGRETDLTVATVHQAWRFHRRFHLVVVDEADAYPLKGDPRLWFGLERVTAAGGTRCWVTATPLPSWRQKVREGRWTAVTLPARYHGWPTPVPRKFRIWRLWNRLERGKTIPPLEAFLERVASTRGQAMIFVPRIRDTDSVLQWIRACLPPSLRKRCGSVTGRDGHRKMSVAAFRKGTIQYLVTTTILERGVTVPRCHVAVVGADHPVFDASTLIQIAGRVGRSPQYQAGEVWWFTAVWTQPQIEAIREITRMNRLAEKKGFLRNGKEDPK